MDGESPRLLILASTSATRIALLKNAGLDFSVEAPRIDERAVEEAAGGHLDGEDLALVLAEAKAVEVSERFPEALVIGADQTLEYEGEILHKPKDAEAARRQLLHLAGDVHFLHAAVVMAEKGAVIFRHTDRASLFMRAFTPRFVGHYLAHVGARALQSVGAYQIEGAGIQLFDKIEGDHFTILGLPLLPLLHELRRQGMVER